MKSITLTELMTDAQYKAITESQLAYVINHKMLYVEYKKLDGYSAQNKAEKLIKKWKQEKATK